MTACGGKSNDEGFRTVCADMSEVDTIDISSGRVVALEANDSSLLYNITNMEKAGDRLIIHSRGLLKAFNSKTGKYLGDVATRGAGPTEFNGISQIFVEDDTIRLLDFNTASLISYLGDGTFVSRKSTRSEKNTTDHYISTPVYFMPDPSGEGYVSLNCFTDGTTETNPTASLYDRNIDFIRDIAGRSLREGSYLPDRMAPDVEGKRLLMWEPFRDTLFTVTPDTIRPWLAFDFGANSFPAEYQGLPEMYQRAEKFLEGKNVPYLSYLRSYQKLGDILFFSASVPEGGNFLCRLDLRSDKVRLYKIADAEGRYKQTSNLKIIDGELYVELTDMESEEANPALFIIAPSRFE